MKYLLPSLVTLKMPLLTALPYILPHAAFCGRRLTAITGMAGRLVCDIKHYTVISFARIDHAQH